MITLSGWYGPVVPNKVADKYVPASYQDIGGYLGYRLDVNQGNVTSIRPSNRLFLIGDTIEYLHLIPFQCGIRDLAIPSLSQQ